MKMILTSLGYLKWHYSRAILALSQIWKSFLYFVYDFFSIRPLFMNFFDPWKRMAENYPKTFDFKKYFYTFLTNLIVRAVGVIMRTGLIIVGLFCYVLLALLYPVALAIWILLPFIIIFLIGAGLSLIILK